VLKRPGIDEFLAEMSKIYEVVIYTASTSNYANPLLDILDPHRLAPYRLFKENCTILGNLITKNLAKLGRDLKDVIIIDNSPIAYILQPGNAIPISTWTGNTKDNELTRLIPILKFLAKTYDVREGIKGILKDNKVNYENALEILNCARKEGPVKRQAVKIVSNLEPKKSKAIHVLNLNYKLSKKYSEESPKISKSESLIAKGMPVKAVHDSKVSFSQAVVPKNEPGKPRRNHQYTNNNSNAKTLKCTKFTPPSTNLPLKRIESANIFTLNHFKAKNSYQSSLNERNYKITSASTSTAESKTPHGYNGILFRNTERIMTRANSVDIYKTSYGEIDFISEEKVNVKEDTHSSSFMNRINQQRKALNEYYSTTSKLSAQLKGKNNERNKETVRGNMYSSSIVSSRPYGVYPCQILIGRNSWLRK